MQDSFIINNIQKLALKNWTWQKIDKLQLNCIPFYEFTKTIHDSDLQFIFIYNVQILF